jgi:hypothetical protein
MSNERDAVTVGGPIRADIATMLSHLRRCRNQQEDVKTWANDEFLRKYLCSRASSAHPFAVPLAPVPHASSSHQPTQILPPLSMQDLLQNTFYPQPGFTPQLSPLEINNPSPSLVIDAPIPQLYSPYANALGFSTHPSPSVISNLSLSRPPSGSPSYPHSPTISQPVSRSLSSNFDQHAFNMHIGRMTVAAGLPLGWTDNPEVRSVFRIYFPWAQLPSRRSLSRTILPALQNSLRTEAQKEARGSNCTLQCDGWTGINLHHLIAFMITVWPKVCA